MTGILSLMFGTCPVAAHILHSKGSRTDLHAQMTYLPRWPRTLNSFRKRETKNENGEPKDKGFGTGSILEARKIVVVYAKTYTVYKL